MTGHPASRALACPGEGWGRSRDRLDRSNRRGQDTSRKVRPVGREKDYNEDSDLRHIANYARALLVYPDRLFCSAFHTLRR